MRDKHHALLNRMDDDARADRLCELNVLEQVVNVAETTVVRDAWARGQALTVHGWIYGLRDGYLRDVGINVSSMDEVEPGFHAALAGITRR